MRKFQAEWADLFNRWHRPGSEEFVYFGWLTPVLAVVGLVVLWRGRRWLAVLLGLGAIVPILLALGTNLPTYSVLWHALPPLRFPRVPERFMPIADLALAALLAFAVAELVRRAGRRGMAVAAGLLVLVALDLGAQPVSATAADPDNAAYAALSGPGRILDLPLFDPGIHYGASTTTTSCRRLASGRRATTPSHRGALIRSRSPTTGSAAGSGSRATKRNSRAARRRRASSSTRGVYEQAGDRSAWFAWRGLEEAGWAPTAQGGAVTLLRARLVVGGRCRSPSPHGRSLSSARAGGTGRMNRAPGAVLALTGQATTRCMSPRHALLLSSYP